MATERLKETQAPAEPDDLWRNIQQSSVNDCCRCDPCLVLCYWRCSGLLRRKRNKERREMQAQEAVMAVMGAAGV